MALLAGQTRPLLRLLATSLLLNLLGLAVPAITQLILDRVVPAGDLTLLSQLVLVMALATALQIGLIVWRRLILVQLSTDLDRMLLGAFCAHVLTLPIQFFKVRRAGELVARFTEGEQVRSLVAGSLTRAVIDSALVLLYFSVLCWYSAQLGLFVMAVLLAFTFYITVLGPWVQRLHHQLLEAKAVHEARLVELITSIDLVKALAIEPLMQDRWDQAYSRYLATSQRTQTQRQLTDCGGMTIKFVCTAGVLWWGAALVIGAHLSIGQLVAITMYANEALAPLVRLAAVWDEFQEIRVVLKRVQEVLDQRPESQLPAEARHYPTAISGHVRCEHVFFNYNQSDQPPLLRGVSFELVPGEHVALVGRSGSGKTTLARLLLGLYRPSQGQVCIDGWDLCDLDLATYRRQVGVIVQENLLLSGTIYENIALGDRQPDRQRVIEAALCVGADEFIAALPQGYDTMVGEMGLTLSGGQRQRLSLARLAYRDPRLVILDEATNALDGPSARAVHRALATLLAGRTALIIAHQPTTIRYADRILVLHDGIIAEQGTHDQLLAHRGRYAELVAGATVSDAATPSHGPGHWRR
jgi:ATP-binding cassette subfamily B protein